jgi:hypothetical protein
MKISAIVFQTDIQSSFTDSHHSLRLLLLAKCAEFASQRTQVTSTRRTDKLILYRAIMAVYVKNIMDTHTHINCAAK